MRKGEGTGRGEGKRDGSGERRGEGRRRRMSSCVSKLNLIITALHLL